MIMFRKELSLSLTIMDRFPKTEACDLFANMPFESWDLELTIDDFEGD